MISCFVIDDEAHALEILCDLISSVPGLELIGNTTNPLAGLELVTSDRSPDLTFVDINMPELSGIEFAELVNLYTTVIFTTAYDQFAVEAFEKEAFDYLLKPITHERFLKCINKYKKLKIKNSFNYKDEYFYVKCDVKGKMVRININDVTYIEGALNYIIINTITNKPQITYLTLAEIQNHLSPTSFSRIHKSFIVNNDKIKSVAGNIIILEDGTILNIGNFYKDSFFEDINKKMVKSKRFP